MPDLPTSYRAEPGGEFATRLERVLVQRLTAPASSKPTGIPRVTPVSDNNTTPASSTSGEDDALIDLDPMVVTRRGGRRRLTTTIAFAAAAAAVIALALTAAIRIEDDLDPAEVPPTTLAAPPTTLAAPPTTLAAPPTTVTAGEQSPPFEGTWASTDTDGSPKTMEIARSDIDFEVVVRNDSDRVCSGAASTMIGTGRVDADGTLSLPRPSLNCDDGSTPAAPDGAPSEELPRDLTFLHDPRNDTVTDTSGMVWARHRPEDPDPEVSADMWPQSSIDEARQAQGLADAGDAAYTWQVDPQLESQESDPLLTDTSLWTYLTSAGPEIVNRFLHEELGWEGFLFSGEATPLNADGLRGLVYVRCSPGENNPLYPIAPDGQQSIIGGERCAPTIDDLRYEAVSLDLSQPAGLGSEGIWVVSRWTSVQFAQADPKDVEAKATARLEEFLQARIDGDGAEGYVEVFYFSGGSDDVPLLYATTTGAPYERYELERVGQPHWPNGGMEYTVRLFADDGQTVVEQPISLVNYTPGRQTFHHSAVRTTENGEPVPEP